MQNPSNLKKYGVAKYSDELVDAFNEWEEARQIEADRKFLAASVNNLGIGPKSVDYVENTLKPAGAVIVTADGYAWANGWNASNYLEKLEGSKGYTIPGWLKPKEQD